MLAQICTQSWYELSALVLLSCWFKNKFKSSFQLNLLYEYRIRSIRFFLCSSKPSQKWIPALGQGWPESIFSLTRLPQGLKLQVLFYKQEGNLLSISKTSAELALVTSATQASENIFYLVKCSRSLQW